MLDDFYALIASLGMKEPLHSPITHMPIGLVVGALVFFIVALVFKKKDLVMTARHVSILAFIFAFPTILLGVMDWIHFYHAVLFTPIKIKMTLAAVVLVVLGTGIVLGSEIKVRSVAMTVLYSLAFVCVIGLGYFGSGIIYGRGLEMKPKVRSVAPAPAKREKAAVPQSPGFEEKTGSVLPLDPVFITETGERVSLGDVVNGRPTVLSFIYYRCPNECSLLLNGIASVLVAWSGKPANAPNVVTISFDENEKPADAAKAKDIAWEIIGKPYPRDRWRFLTGSRESIARTASAAGFGFAPKGGSFDHPLGLIILSPGGKIVRYILGTDYLPVDISISLMEASKGVTGPTIARVLRFCFSYDPKNKRLVFNILRVSATVVFTFIGVFIFYLALSLRRRRTAGGRP